MTAKVRVDNADLSPRPLSDFPKHEHLTVNEKFVVSGVVYVVIESEGQRYAAKALK